MDSEIDDVPVFDRRDYLPSLIDSTEDWQPARTRVKASGVMVKLPGDGPSEDHRIKAGQAWYSSQFFSGQAANDNQDWPLAKLLRTEKNEGCLRLAERYRQLHDTATMPTQLVGREATDLYVVQNIDEDGKNRGAKVVRGKKANLDIPAKRIVMAGSETKTRAAPVPKRWCGDWPLLANIDAKRELAVIRGKLAYLPKVLDAFEWSVIDGLTLEDVGSRLGAGSKGAKGEARAQIWNGFYIVDHYWRSQRAA